MQNSTYSRKRRTREHIIADLSVNHVERHALLCGYTVERTTRDYGFDLTVTTFDANGEIENGIFCIQMKATDTLSTSSNGDFVPVTLDSGDVDYWLGEEYPILLVIYDASADVAYWLHIQDHFAARLNFSMAQAGQTITVRVPMGNVVDQQAMREFARRRDAAIRSRRE